MFSKRFNVDFPVLVNEGTKGFGCDHGQFNDPFGEGHRDSQGLSLLRQAGLVVAPVCPMPNAKRTSVAFFRRPVVYVNAGAMNRVFTILGFCWYVFIFEARDGKQGVASDRRLFSQGGGFVRGRNLRDVGVRVDLYRVLRFVGEGLCVAFIRTVRRWGSIQECFDAYRFGARG